MVCDMGWGIGINTHENYGVSYGFPESENPNLFFPDAECCTNEEILNHINAVVVYNQGKAKEW